LVLAHVCQEGAAVAVPDGIQPVAVDAQDAQPIVNVGVATRFFGKADAVEAYVAGLRAASDGDEDLVGGELSPVFEDGDDRPVRAGSTRRGHAGPHDDGDALGLERGTDLLACKRFLVGEQPVERLDDRDLVATQALERLGHLGADGATAEHEEPPGELLGRGDVTVVPRRDVA
jgi:hypothetical protein